MGEWGGGFLLLIELWFKFVTKLVMGQKFPRKCVLTSPESLNVQLFLKSKLLWCDGYCRQPDTYSGQ